MQKNRFDIHHLTNDLEHRHTLVLRKMSIKNIRSELDRRRGEEKRTRRNLQEAKDRLTQCQEDLELHEQAREVIKAAGLRTQRALAFHISDISSLAMEAVFDDPYNLVVDFVQRRNKTECDLWFEQNGNQVAPMLASGGGVVDVAAFSLRVASWSMQLPRSRPVIILDEPMRFLSADLQPKASEMIAQLSEKLGLQFLIITHEEELTEQADRVFSVSRQNRISKVD